MTAAAVTHRGHVRRVNEDSMLVTPRLVAVADGMGGHVCGDVASRLAVHRLRGLREHPELTPDDVTAAIAGANDDVLADARRHPERLGMGTTLAGLAVVRAGGTEHCLVFNVGDSRVYRVDEERGLQQVTVDHSEVEELRAAGRITDEEAARHPRRNVVTRCVGSVPTPTPDLWLFPPQPRERFVVCSDGLTLEVTDAAIAEVLGEHERPGAAASALLEAALAAGGRDNIAVIVVDLEDGAERGASAARAETVPRGRITQRS